MFQKNDLLKYEPIHFMVSNYAEPTEIKNNCHNPCDLSDDSDNDYLTDEMTTLEFDYTK